MMKQSLSWFMARRLSGEKNQGHQASRPAVIISITGIALGLAVMLVAVCVIVGFKQQVRAKITGFSGDVMVTHMDAASLYEARPIVASDSLLAALTDHPEVRHVQRFSTKPGMIKTTAAFQGMVLKGVGAEYDRSFIRQHMVEGEFPQFSDSASSYRVVISNQIAQLLHIRVGDKIDAYFIEQNVRARRFKVVGIYNTNFAEFDKLYIFTDICTVNRLNTWQPDEVSGLELELRDYKQLEAATWDLADRCQNSAAASTSDYCVLNAEQLNPAIFAWLGILDVNIWVILGLMMGVAGFTMISGLLILIIERTSTIGVLKSLGADNFTIRGIFLWLSVFIIGRGMLWGNALGLVFYAVQRFTGVFKLDPATYYMDVVPVELHFSHWLLLNIGTLAISVLMLVGPSYLIAKIRPAASMRYE